MLLPMASDLISMERQWKLSWRAEPRERVHSRRPEHGAGRFHRTIIEVLPANTRIVMHWSVIFIAVKACENNTRNYAVSGSLGIAVNRLLKPVDVKSQYHHIEAHADIHSRPRLCPESRKRHTARWGMHRVGSGRMPIANHERFKGR